MESKGKTEQRINPPRPPTIYKLIEEQASTSIIAQQLYADFYAAKPDPEKVYLAVDELQRRPDGNLIIDKLAEATDELGVLMQKIKNKKIAGRELESVLGIKRLVNVTSLSQFKSGDDYIRNALNYAYKKGYTKKHPEECLNDIYRRQQMDNQNTLPAHLSREVDSEVISESSTFGSEEIAYLELLGPREILRLRSTPNPNFLLLGSFGIYSAREFRQYAKKINPNIKPFVVDNHDDSIRELSSDSDNKGRTVQGDARSLPFKNETMDHVYTNFLLRFLGWNERRHDMSVDLNNLFAKAFKVLKPGGSFVLCETPGGSFNLPEVDFVKKIINVATKAGFRIAQIDESTFTFMVRKDIGSCIIDSNGFPHYGDILIDKPGAFHPFTVRFIKP